MSKRERYGEALLLPEHALMAAGWTRDHLRVSEQPRITMLFRTPRRFFCPWPHEVLRSARLQSEPKTVDSFDTPCR